MVVVFISKFYKFLLIIIIITLLSACDKKEILSIHIIDVGQGDSILINTPSNKKILIDGGNEDSEHIIRNYLRKEKIKNSKYGSQFFDKIKAIETDETRLLKLQKSYESGEVKEEDLTDEQVDKLLELYQDQIDGLRISNERRKQKLLEYREKMKKAI